MSQARTTEEKATMTNETATLSLTPHHHDKLGIVHCGVTREGFIVVGGDPRDIADGQEIIFERARIKARRDGNKYTFTRVG
jgi:hypothetical protein